MPGSIGQSYSHLTAGIQTIPVFGFSTKTNSLLRLEAEENK